MTARPTSGKSDKLRRDGVAAVALRVTGTCAEHGVSCVLDRRPGQPGKPVILRMRALDAELAPEGGTAVLTLYATGSWTWGGDADAVAHAREPIERGGLLS